MSDKRISSIASFGKDGAEGQQLSAQYLGARGFALCELGRIGLPVPAGFVLNIEAVRSLVSGDAESREQVRGLVAKGLLGVEAETGRQLGNPKSPLLLAVRPSTPTRMPRALHSVLNLGLNDETVEGLGAQAGDHAFAHDCYRRLIQNYAHVVLGDDPASFDDLMGAYLEERGLSSSRDVRGTDGPELANRFKTQIAANGGRVFPQDVIEQLWNAIIALARQWQSPRAKQQRKLHGVKDDVGLGIVVQAMVFGNQSDFSGSGTATSRDAEAGSSLVHGVFLPQAQGSDLEASLQPVLPLTDLANGEPELGKALAQAVGLAEREMRDGVSLDFTIAQKQLWILDAAPAKRSTAANLKILNDMVASGLINERAALLRIEPLALDQLLHATIAPNVKRSVVAQGLAASPGAACGMIIFSSEEARVLAGQGHNVILVRTETAPEDIKALNLAAGVLTTRGGLTSHAAVIARGMGKPCVSGASSLRIDVEAGVLKAGSLLLNKGDIITIDGSSGQVMKGEVPLSKPTLSADFANVLTWADKVRRMKVRANVESAPDAKLALDFGAEGIGLSRTEHMFFDGDRIIAMREMILADSERDRRAALAKLLPVLRLDLIGLFTVMAGLPVTVRLLDPPLHEFLPTQAEEIVAVAKSLGLEPSAFRKRVLELREQNPMLGHRGVRLLLSYPEITDMQARAIFEAAAAVKAASGKAPIPEIMVPLVASREELEAVRLRIDAVAAAVAKDTGQKVEHLVGTMIELPRAALKAADIAEAAEFFSFGTNDLTQTTYGISRDDASRFISEYTSRRIFRHDPFVSLDVDGVGELIKLAVERGRQGRASIGLGVCGEHGGEPESISFFEAVGLDYVSCSPFRVPIARLAAAQATLRSQES